MRDSIFKALPMLLTREEKKGYRKKSNSDWDMDISNDSLQRIEIKSLHTTGTPHIPGRAQIFDSMEKRNFTSRTRKVDPTTSIFHQAVKTLFKSDIKRRSAKFIHLQLAGSVEVLKSLLGALGHGLLTLTDPDAGVEELLVGLVSTVGVTDSGHEVVLLAQDVVTDTGQVGVLHVSVDVDLDDTVANGLLVFGLGGTGATVEDEEDGLVLGGLGLLLDVGLVLGEQLRVQTDVTGLVDTVNIAEASGNGEVGANSGQGVVDGQNVLGLRVEGVVVDILVVDTILLTTGDTDLLLIC